MDCLRFELKRFLQGEKSLWKSDVFAKIEIFLLNMGVARAWSRWPTEIFSPSLMHTVNLYLSNVGSKMAISIMVLKIELPPNCTFSITLSIYLSIYLSVPKPQGLSSCPSLGRLSSGSIYILFAIKGCPAVNGCSLITQSQSNSLML